MFQFEWPWLFILLPLPLLVWRYLAAQEQSQQSALQVPIVDQISTVVNRSSFSDSASASRLSTLLLCAIWLLLVITVARPQWIGEPMPQQLQGRDLMLAIDLSESMAERDFQLRGQMINRLDATKLVAGDFIERREGDRIGLILFATQAYLQAPLSHDRQTVQQLLSEAVLGLAGKATAIGDAIGLAIKRFKAMDNPQRILILLTDGSNTAGLLDPVKATELAKAEQVKIYTIGVGADGSSGLLGGFFNRAPQIDERTLSYIAEQTGGRYFRAQDLDQLAEVYQLLDELETVEQDEDFYRPLQSLYHWPLLAAIFLLVPLILLQQRRL